MSDIQLSKRIAAFKSSLIKEIPRFPNNKETLETLQNKALTDLLIIYIGWRMRFVAPRPRRLIGESILDSDLRAKQMKFNIANFHEKVVNGDDLTPYLSLNARKRGYSPQSEIIMDRPKTWADKDFLLNVMGLHHFHLGLKMEKTGHAKRTDEVLFASVNREEFKILGLFDHKVFEYEENGTMKSERQRIWSIYEVERSSRSLPGQLYMGGFGGLGIATSGQPVLAVRIAQIHAKIIREIDTQLDDINFLSKLFPDNKYPSKIRPQWLYHYLDFGIFEKGTSCFACLHKGAN